MRARPANGFNQGLLETLFRRTTGKCARFSEEASFSSSLKGLFVVQGFRVAGWLRGLRDGAKSTIRPRRGQAPQAASPGWRPVRRQDERTSGRKVAP